VKVMDFGIARALHGASTTMTQTGMVMGTPQYLSPEQALGKAVDYRSDLYATGCLLYELLALRPPFVGETPLSVVYQHVQDTPVPPSQVADGPPPELDGLVMRSLAKDPDDRFQTAEEMRGMVQYGLQMLYDQGSHTGTWNTGPVQSHDGRSTPAAGFARTTAMPHPHLESGTQQIPQPLLPAGYGDGDDGGFEGHGNRGSGRGKLWILAALAVIAVVAGVAIALHGNGGKPGAGPSQSPTTTTTPKDKKPSETPPEDSTGDTSTDDNTGTGSGPDYRHSYTPSQPYSRQPPVQPSSPVEQTTDQPSEPTATEQPTDTSTGGGGGAPDPTPSDGGGDNTGGPLTP